jgi:hypothetical protein
MKHDKFSCFWYQIGSKAFVNFISGTLHSSFGSVWVVTNTQKSTLNYIYEGIKRGSVNQKRKRVNMVKNQCSNAFKRIKRRKFFPQL